MSFWRGMPTGHPTRQAKGFRYRCPKGHEQSWSERPAGRANCNRCGRQLKYVGRG
jgi:hypothetical protein